MLQIKINRPMYLFKFLGLLFYYVPARFAADHLEKSDLEKSERIRHQLLMLTDLYFCR